MVKTCVNAVWVLVTPLCGQGASAVWVPRWQMLNGSSLLWKSLLVAAADHGE
jgi:hypothetical protein